MTWSILLLAALLVLAVFGGWMSVVLNIPDGHFLEVAFQFILAAGSLLSCLGIILGALVLSVVSFFFYVRYSLMTLLGVTMWIGLLVGGIARFSGPARVLMVGLLFYTLLLIALILMTCAPMEGDARALKPSDPSC